MPVKATGMSLAVSVTTKRMVISFLCTVPTLTKPPMRKARSFGASPAVTWVGV